MTQPIPLIAPRLAGLLTATLLVGCATVPLEPDSVRLATSPTSPEIVILKSGDNGFFNGPAEGFLETIDAKVSVFTLSESTSREVVAGIQLANPQLIFALGTAATKLASRHFKDIPIIFSMVMNYERHGFQNQSNLAGIAVEMDPAMEFLQYKMVAPTIQKVVSFHGSKSVPSFALKSIANLKMLGIELELVPVRSLSDLRNKASEKLTDADAVWFINDPVVGRREAFELLREESIRNQKPLIASLSDQFAELGAMMTVAVDFKAVGAQAASMARGILIDKSALSDIGIRSPMAGQLTVNLEAAKKIQLSIAPETLPNINRVIGND